jgi:hypothetical protein
MVGNRLYNVCGGANARITPGEEYSLRGSVATINLDYLLLPYLWLLPSRHVLDVVPAKIVATEPYRKRKSAPPEFQQLRL